MIPNVLDLLFLYDFFILIAQHISHFFLIFFIKLRFNLYGEETFLFSEMMNIIHFP